MAGRGSYVRGSSGFHAALTGISQEVTERFYNLSSATRLCRSLEEVAELDRTEGPPLRELLLTASKAQLMRTMRRLSKATPYVTSVP